MAEMGLAPKRFAQRCGRTGTPLNAIALQYVVIALLVSLDFDAIISVDNFFSAVRPARETPKPCGHPLAIP